MPDEPLRLLILAAHPDDAEYHAGGLATLYREAGHVVRMVALTNGDAGHHVLRGAELAARRKAEAQAAAELIGAEADVWDHHDGHLQPTLELRWQVIAEMRRFQPDLVLTHRTNDYHPDHRAAGHAVRDAAYLLIVPSIVPEVPVPKKVPVIAYLPDRFTKPAPLAGDVVVDVGEWLDTVVAMLACHESQFFEWLPHTYGILDQVPAEAEARKRWLKDRYAQMLQPQADKYRQELVATYGDERGAEIEYAEVFEISEYAAPLDEGSRRRLFFFLPG